MEKSLLISLKLNFPPNTLGCYGLSDRVRLRGYEGLSRVGGFELVRCARSSLLNLG